MTIRHGRRNLSQGAEQRSRQCHARHLEQPLRQDAQTRGRDRPRPTPTRPRQASSKASRAPREFPRMCTAASPRASRSSSRASARAAIVGLPSTGSASPCPGHQLRSRRSAPRAAGGPGRSRLGSCRAHRIRTRGSPEPDCVNGRRSGIERHAPDEPLHAFISGSAFSKLMQLSCFEKRKNTEGGDDVEVAAHSPAGRLTEPRGTSILGRPGTHPGWGPVRLRSRCVSRGGQHEPSRCRSAPASRFRRRHRAAVGPLEVESTSSNRWDGPLQARLGGRARTIRSFPRGGGCSPSLSAILATRSSPRPCSVASFGSSSTAPPDSRRRPSDPQGRADGRSQAEG